MNAMPSIYPFWVSFSYKLSACMFPCVRVYSPVMDGVCVRYICVSLCLRVYVRVSFHTIFIMSVVVNAALKVDSHGFIA